VAERIPSAIDKFLVHGHLLRKEERQGEMGGERDREREWRVKRRVWRGGNGNARKIAPKCNIFGIDAPWGLPPRIIHV